MTYQIVERLGEAGAAEAARKLADAWVDEVPDITRNQSLRTTGRFLAIAHAFESAIETNDVGALRDLSDQWRSNVLEQELQRAEARERDTQAGLPFSH